MIIFDKKLLRLVKERSVHFTANENFDNFLVDISYSDLIERLETITKTTDNILELGYKAPFLKDFFAHNSQCQNYIASNYINYFPNNSENIILDPEFLCFKDEMFDLIISVLDFHHINDFPGSLIQIRNSLKSNGLFIASLFAGDTLFELKQSMIEAEIALNLPITPHIFPFAEISDLGSLLQRAKFKDVIIDNFTLTVSYNSVLDLMHDLKKMGESNILIERTKKSLSRNLLYKINEIYQNKFCLEDGSLKASFNIATITGIK